MKEMKIIGLNGEKVIVSMLKATKKVCEERDMSAEQRTVMELLVFKITQEFLRGLAKETEEIERDEPSDILDELFEGIVNMFSGGDDDE